MLVDEWARYELQRTLIEILGEEAAMTLMSHLPPSGWADVASRHHIEVLERRIADRFDRVEEHQDRIDERLDQRLRQFIATTIAAVFAAALASAGIATAATGLT